MIELNSQEARFTRQVGTLGGKERCDGRLRCALSLSGLFFATRDEVEKVGKPHFEIGFSQCQFGAVAVVVLDDQTRLAEDAKLISCLKVFPTRQSSKTPGRCLVESLSAPWFPIVTLEKLVIAQCVRHRGTDRSF